MQNELKRLKAELAKAACEWAMIGAEKDDSRAATIGMALSSVAMCLETVIESETEPETEPDIAAAELAAQCNVNANRWAVMRAELEKAQARIDELEAGVHDRTGREA